MTIADNPMAAITLAVLLASGASSDEAQAVLHVVRDERVPQTPEEILERLKVELERHRQENPS